MDISTVTSNSSNYQQSNLDIQVGSNMLRKALDMQAANAQQLIESVPESSASPNGASALGQQIDTWA
jgi:hypothetical protein